MADQRVRGGVKSIKENYCFLTDSITAIDRFAHRSEFSEADWKGLKVHQAVEYKPVDEESGKGPRAVQVTVVTSGPSR